MIESRRSLFYKLWFPFLGVLIITNIFLLSASGTASTSHTSEYANVSNNPNVIAGGMTVAANEFKHKMGAIGYSINSSAQSLAVATAHSASFVGRNAIGSAAFLGRNAVGSAAFLGQNAVGSIAFLVHSAGHIVVLVSKPADLVALVRPADKTSVPVIIPVPTPPAPPTPTTSAAPVAPPARPTVKTASQITPQADSVARWPIHGAITTLFGVPELPYERIHTGLDISDGKRPGITPVKPFKPGQVIQIVRSSVGLGNHIVVDNGGGVTSVYGHLYSISVQMGQQVNQESILGYEGSTGASTGTHLHFEIRINGQPVDPLKYISGRP